MVLFILIFFNLHVQAQISGNESPCKGGEYEYTYDGGKSCFVTTFWVDGGVFSDNSTTKIVQADATTGLFTVKVTWGTSSVGTISGTGCQNYGMSLNVSIKDLPTVTVLPPSQTIVAGHYTALFASGADSYKWVCDKSTCHIVPGPDTINASVDVYPYVTTTYTVTGTSSEGCTDTAQAVVIVTPSSSGSGSGGGLYKINIENCDGSSSLPQYGGVPGLISGSDDNITAGQQCGFTEVVPDYTWYSSPDGINWTKLPQTTKDLQPDYIEHTTYYKRGTQQNKCTGHLDTGPNGSLIADFILAFSAPGYAFGYIAPDGGIHYSNIIKVTVGLIANPNILVCSNSPVTLTGTGADSYAWYVSNVLVSTSPTFNSSGYAQSQLLNVVGSWKNCPNKRTEYYIVDVVPPNVPAPTVVGTPALCSTQPNAVYSLVGNDQNLTWQWSIAGTVAAFSSSNTGNSVTVGISPITGSSGFTISAKAINPCGTSEAGSMYVSVDGSMPYSAPSAPTGPTTVINSAAPTSYSLSTMANAVYTITPANAVASSTTNQYGQITVDWNDSFAGQASITAKLQNGCGVGPSSSPLTVQVNNPPPVIAVSGPLIVCNDGTTYWYLSNTSNPNVVFEILPSAAVKSYNYNVNAYGNVAVTWASTYAGPVTIRVSVNGSPWSPIENVTVFDKNKSAVFSNSSKLAKASGIDPHLAFGANDFTLEGWFKLGSTTGYTYPLFSTRQISPSAGFLFYVNPNSGGNAYLGISAEGANKNTIIPGGLTAGTWYHAAIVRTSGVLTYYINGLQVGTTSSLTNSITAPRELWIGHDPSAPFANLTIDEVRIWTRARTASEIYTNMNKNITGNDVNLVSYYTFDDPSTSQTYVDYTIWNHTLTKGNDSTVETSYDPTSSTDVPYPGCTAGNLREGDDQAISTVSFNGLSSQSFNVSLYPNPTENSASLEILNNMSLLATVEILSSSGEVVFKKDQVSTESPLKIGDNLSPGFYIIKVISGGNQKMLKFVKSN